MTWLVAAEAILGEQREPAADTAVPVRVTELDGNTVWLRPRSRDRAALEFLHAGHHLPPAGLNRPVRHAAVFGAHIGLLLAGLAARYPQARVLGVEADHDNAALAHVTWIASAAGAACRKRPSGTATKPSPSPGNPTRGARSSPALAPERLWGRGAAHRCH